MTAGLGPREHGVRGVLQSMPVPVAAAFVLLAAASVVVMLLALLSGLLAEFAERLAGAGWAGATALRVQYVAEDPGGPSTSARTEDRGSSAPWLSTPGDLSP